jgi:hypothetical protein
MFIPPQGFRHAAVLLIDKASRAIPGDASPEAVSDALVHLAHELVALATDMRAAPEWADWLRAEYAHAVERLPHPINRTTAVRSGTAIISTGNTRPREIDSRDLFLVYRPEDRLAIAAPLAVELAKRRVSVAFSEYEVASEEQLAAALGDGLARHRRGVVLWTAAFERTRWELPVTEGERLRILREPDLQVAIGTLADWVRRRVCSAR